MSQAGRLWLPGMQHRPSPNADERPSECAVDLLVVHSISLPPGKFGGPHIDDLFLNRLDATAHPYFARVAHLTVSAHLLVQRNGATTQFVALERRAWHAGRSHFGSRRACNDFSIGIELEGSDDSAFTSYQYLQLARLTLLIQAHFPAITANRIVGHSDIAPGRKTDPGPHFNWQLYRGLLAHQ